MALQWSDGHGSGLVAHRAGDNTTFVIHYEHGPSGFIAMMSRNGETSQIGGLFDSLALAQEVCEAHK